MIKVVKEKEYYGVIWIYITFFGKVTHVHLKHNEVGAQCAIILDMEVDSFFPNSF